MTIKDEIGQVASYLAKLAHDDHPALRAVVAVAAGAWAYVVGVDGTRPVISAGVLIVIDVVTGVAASFYEGKPIRSRTLGRLFSKLIAYGAAITTVSVAVREVFNNDAAAGGAVVGVAVAVIIREGHSIFENVIRLDIPIPPNMSDAIRKRLGLERERGSGENPNAKP